MPKKNGHTRALAQQFTDEVARVVRNACRDPGSAYSNISKRLHKFGSPERHGCKWTVASSTGARAFASLRVTCTNPGFERELRERTRRVKRVLMRKNWSMGSTELRRALELHEDDPEEPTEGEDLCRVCDGAISRDLLFGKHHCRAIAEYRCKRCRRNFTSVRARVDPVANPSPRVLDQDCHYCFNAGKPCKTTVVSWQPSTPAVRDRYEDVLAARDARRENTGQGADSGRGGSGRGVSNGGSGRGVGSGRGGSGRGVSNGGSGRGVGSGRGGPGRGGESVRGGAGSGRGGNSDGLWGKGGKGESVNDWAAAGGEGADESAGSSAEWDKAPHGLESRVLDSDEKPARVNNRGDHHPHLCEGCKMYGDCSGFYADPDLVMKAVSTMDVHHGKGFKWDREQGLMKLSITLEDGSEAEVHLIPFVTSTTSQRDQWFHTQMATSISDTESSESDGVGCYNCGDHGHMQRHCPRSRGCYTCGEFGHFSRECTSR